MTKTRDTAPTFNAADATQVEHVEDAMERIEKERRYAYLETLRAYTGRRVLWDLLTQCGVFGSIYSSDAIAMAFRSGQQDFGHKLQADLLDIDESLYDQMAREARARAKQEAVVMKAMLANRDDSDMRGDDNA